MDGALFVVLRCRSAAPHSVLAASMTPASRSVSLKSPHLLAGRADRSSSNSYRSSCSRCRAVEKQSRTRPLLLRGRQIRAARSCKSRVSITFLRSDGLQSSSVCTSWRWVLRCTFSCSFETRKAQYPAPPCSPSDH